MVALARRYGAQPAAPSIADVDARPLVERAIENVVEGCVGKAVAAIHAAFHATYAADPAVRDTFAKIACDETEHALLSHDLAVAYARHLDAMARERVMAAYVAAVAGPGYRQVTPALAALGIADDGELGRTIDRALAALAPRLRGKEPSRRDAGAGAIGTKCSMAVCPRRAALNPTWDLASSVAVRANDRENESLTKKETFREPR
jgi:hypothetical protein